METGCGSAVWVMLDSSTTDTGMVVHACNPSTQEGEARRYRSSIPFPKTLLQAGLPKTVSKKERGQERGERGEENKAK